MKKAKAKKAKMTEATTTVASQMGTVSNLKPIVKETNLNGPAMMYFVSFLEDALLNFYVFGAKLNQ